MEGYYILLLIIQLLFYGLVDHIKIKYGRLIVLCLFLSLFLLFLPLCYPVPENCCECGGLFDYFTPYWNIGISTVVAAHFIYCFILNKKLKKII